MDSEELLLAEFGLAVEDRFEVAAQGPRWLQSPVGEGFLHFFALSHLELERELMVLIYLLVHILWFGHNGLLLLWRCLLSDLAGAVLSGDLLLRF